MKTQELLNEAFKALEALAAHNASLCDLKKNTPRVSINRDLEIAHRRLIDVENTVNRLTDE